MLGQADRCLGVALPGRVDRRRQILSDMAAKLEEVWHRDKPLGAAQRILEGLGVASAFYRVLGGDGPHARKPDPQGLFQIITDARTTPAHTTLVGASRIDVATAHAAGCAMCIAAYGFGYDPDLELRGTEMIVQAPRQLPSILSATT